MRLFDHGVAQVCQNCNLTARFTVFGLSVLLLLPLPSQGVAQQTHEARQVQAHSGSASAVAYSRDGKFLATGGSDTLLKIWDGSTLSPIQSLAGHGNAVMSVAIHPEGHLVASGGADHSIKLWDIPQDTPRWSYDNPGLSSFVHRSGNRKWLAWGSNVENHVHLMEISTKERQVLQGHTSRVTGCDFRPDNTHVVTGDESGTIRFWDLKSGEAISTHRAHEAPITGVAYHPNNAQLFTRDALGVVKTWELPIENPKQLATVQQGFEAVVMSGDNKRAIAATATALLIYNLDNGSVLRTIEQQGSKHESLACTVNNELAISGRQDGSIEVHRLDNGERRGAVECAAGTARAVAVFPDNQRFVAAGDDGIVRMWRMPEAPLKFEIAGRYSALAATPNGQFAAIALTDGTIHIVNPNDGKIIRTLEKLPEKVSALTFRADAAQLAIADSKGKVRIFNPHDGKLQHEFEARAGGIVELTYQAADVLLTAGNDGLKKWPLKKIADEDFVEQAEYVTKDVGAAFCTFGSDKILVSRGQELHLLGPAAESKKLCEIAQRPVAVADAKEQDRIYALGSNNELHAYQRQDGRHIFSRRVTAGSTRSARLLVSGDGKSLVAAIKHQLFLFSTADGNLIERFTLDANVVGLSFLPDHRTILAATSGPNGQVTKQRLSGQEVVGTTETGVRSLHVSPDGAQVVAGTAAGQVFVWKVDERKLWGNWSSGESAVGAIAFTKDNSRLLCGNEEGTVSIWPRVTKQMDDESPERLGVIKCNAAVLSLNAANDNQLAVAATKVGDVHVIDMTEFALRQTFARTERAATGAAIATDSRTIVMVDRAGGLRAARVAALRSLSLPATPAATLDGSAGMMIAAVEQQVELIQIEAGKTTKTLAAESPLICCCANADRSRVAAATENGQIIIWNVSDGRVLAKNDVNKTQIVNMTFNDSTNLLATVDVDGLLRFWEASTGELQFEVQVGKTASNIRFLTDINLVVATEGSIGGWRFASKKPLREFGGHGGDVIDLCFHPNGKHLLSASTDKQIRMWDVEKGGGVRQYSGHEATVSGIALSPKGYVMASVSADKTLRIWDVFGGRQIRKLSVGDVGLSSTCFHANGRVVLASGLNKTIYAFDAFTGNRLSTLDGHEDFVYRVHPLGEKHVISLGHGGSIRIWEPEQKGQVREIENTGIINDAVVGPDADRVATVNADGTVRLVPVSLPEPADATQ